METYLLMRAEERLQTVTARLVRVRLMTRKRKLEGLANERDLDLVMRLDAEVERAAARVKEMSRSNAAASNVAEVDHFDGTERG